MRLTATWSVRRRILAWLFAAMALVFSANLISSYYSDVEAADRAYDQLLLASATAIAERTTMREDGLHVDIPYAALGMLASTAQDRIFYQVSGPDGQTITGYDDLTHPPGLTPQQRNRPLVYYNAVYKDVPVRVVALRSFVSSREISGYATILVAQTRGEREELTYSLLRQNAVWMLVIAVVGAIAAWISVSKELQPLARLREALGRRSPDDVRPVLHDVPSEFRPLVDAVNSMLQRLDSGLKSMRSFISDASHQLKTPLASLQTQSEMALRETDPKALRDALTKVNQSVRRTSRLAQQLLSHARATEPTEAFTSVDLARLARETIEVILPQAVLKDIDLGYDGPEHTRVRGAQALLGELILNLVDNAVKYSPKGSIITIAIKTSGPVTVLSVEDNGPGIPEAYREGVFARFVRLDKTTAEGCGLGLAIVQEIATKHGATIELKGRPDGGLRVDIAFPATDQEHAS